MYSNQATDATSGAGRWVKMSAAGTQPLDGGERGG
jgi:hypothetical protein